MIMPPPPYLYEDYALTSNPDFLGRMSITGEPVYRSQVEAQHRMDRFLDEEYKKAKAAEKAEKKALRNKELNKMGVKKLSVSKRGEIEEGPEEMVNTIPITKEEFNGYTPEELMRVKEILGAGVRNTAKLLYDFGPEIQRAYDKSKTLPSRRKPVVAPEARPPVGSYKSFFDYKKQ